MNLLAPSILSADFTILGEQIASAVRGGGDWIHFDVMDGEFVPSISFGLPVLKSIRSCTDRPMDVHLMIVEPERYIEEFVKCGADILTVHLETLKNPETVLKRIRELGVKVGLAINPETSVIAVEPYLEFVDMILVMTVRPGFGGQKYLEYCTEKVERVAAMRQAKGLDFDIEVDGGICAENLELVVKAGANVVVMGSQVFKGDAEENARRFKKVLKALEQ